MLNVIWRQLRGRAGRSVALLIGVLVATTGFVVLTGTTTASRLQVIGTVEQHTRAAYDILVRPERARTPLEAERRLVRPNYLSGLFGGITEEQYDQVKALAGVEVAAPIAMLGHTTSVVQTQFDLTDAVDRSLDRQVIRVDPTYVAERGLSAAAAQPRYVYVTKRPLIFPVLGDTFDFTALPYSDGRSYNVERCGPVPLEVLPAGRTEPVCDPSWYPDGEFATISERQAWSVDAARLLPDGRFESGSAWVPHRSSDRLVMALPLTVPYLLAAVDPEAEEQLVGLTGALVDGRPLNADDTVSMSPNGSARLFPVLATSHPYVDGAIRASYHRLASPPRVTGMSPEQIERVLSEVPAVTAGSSEQDLAAGHRAQLAEGLGETCCFGQLQVVVQPGQTKYDQLPDGTLRPRTFAPNLDAYGGKEEYNYVPLPWLSDDVAYRPLTSLSLSHGSGPVRQWQAVGVFDPGKLAGFSDLSRVPLETYEPPLAEGADESSREALGHQPLLPSGNPAGYLSAPPLLLTNLASVPQLLDGGSSPQRSAPISAIRVRVADVDGYSERSAERVRLIAEQIARDTGLDVDITLGSSPDPQTVEVPAGSFGRPHLRLTENWSALGVASTIVQAIDRKSLLLFLLVLVVCTLFLGNAVSAAVRDRRSELAVLACLGWPARRITQLILGEVAVLGLAAGLLSLALALPISAALGIGIGWQRALLALPVALLLALAAGLLPALRASRAHPAAALGPPVTTARWVRRPRTLLGLALVNLVRTPGRTLLAASALAIGVAALTLVSAAAYAFHGALVGSLLGDAISMSIRGPDAAAAAATVLLGAAAVADVLYLNIRDRARELATLRAIGWTDTLLSRLITYEGLLLGLLGAAAGAALGLAGTTWLVGELPQNLLLVTVLVAVVGTAVTCLAALIPAHLLRRLPTAQLLAEE
ncbi:FtsX-like permease family protein [Micromonospora sp. NPDC049374]|uniref:FtsX-like permease family protein n=1 Tax=Micromonospora sp. NPDC049374 TaxID=3154352 RepID=UPI003441E793